MRGMVLVGVGSCAGDDTEPGTPAPVTFTIVGFNAESGGSQSDLVAEETIAPVRGESIWGLAEVEDDATAAQFVAAAKDPDSDQDFQYVLGTTGRDDRLVLAWDDAKFALERWEELEDINIGGTARAPLVGHMRERSTETAFLLVVNHLWRTDDSARRRQGELLNTWGVGQTGPIVMVGDFNFDWDVEDGTHDRGYDNLVANDVFVWVRPDPIVKTQCSGFNSVLDFSFVGGTAKSWVSSAEILYTDNVYCSSRNEDRLSDHRPVAFTITTP
jgi:hypothetical protein